MSETIKVSTLTRELEVADLEVRKADDGLTRLSFSASSERPVERVFGQEVLSHDPSAIRMERMQAGAMPLLFNHDMNDPIGMIDGGSAKGGRLMVDAHLFNTARANEVRSMMEGGLRNVSIGYRLNEVKQEGKTDTYRATSWEPFEVSIVTVPADPSVGIGRGDTPDSKEVRVVRTVDVVPTPQSGTGVQVSEQNSAAASVTADQVRVSGGTNAVDLENARKRGIENLCKAYKIDRSIQDHWIGTGLGLDAVSDDIVRIAAERGEKSSTVAELGLSKQEAKRFSLMNAVRATADKNWTNAGFELECSREIAKRLNAVPDPNKFYVPMEVQKRDLTVGTTTAGGFLVGTENQSFIELMRNTSVAYRMGATRLSGLQGNVTIPRHTAAATAVWLANEASTATESQQTFGQLSLSPKTVGAYTEISRQLLLQSSPDAEGLVTADLAQVAALAVDLAFLNGSGASGQPTGIITTAGIGSVTGTSIAYAGIVEFQTDVAAGNLLSGSAGYVTTPAVAGLLKQRVKFASTASPLWEGTILEGNVDGYRAMSSNQMPSANILFGDFSKAVIAEWGVLQVEVNPYANFQAGIIGVRAMYSVDVGVRYAGAFSLATSVT